MRNSKGKLAKVTFGHFIILRLFRRQNLTKLARFGTFLVLVLVMAACSTNPTPEVAAPDKLTGPVTLDDQFAEVAKSAPDFGGMFYDDRGQLNVYTAASEGLSSQSLEIQRADVTAAITSVFGKDVLLQQARGEASEEGIQPQSLSKSNIKVLPAKYDFLQLKRWYDGQLGSILGISGLVFTDIDEAQNRLAVGIEEGNTAARKLIEQKLVELGVPREAVIIQETQPVQPAAYTLRSALRPVWNGMQTAMNTGKVCTLGINAYNYTYRVWGFVTNSHCTNAPLVVDGVNRGTKFYQSGVVSSNYIGYEYLDPRFFTGGSCPSGQRCRWSDSAFVRHTTNQFQVGQVARPKSASSLMSSLELNSTYPTIKIVRKNTTYPISGQIPLGKVGRTTGWTYGYVTQTCKTYVMKSYTLLCQYDTNGGVQGGDSGSPVFAFHSNGTATLYGIVWGGNLYAPYNRMIFSPIQNVEYELGSLKTY